MWTVDHRDAHPVGQSADGVGRLAFAKLYGDHGTWLIERADQQAPPAHHRRTVSKGQCADRGGRGDLAHAVADDHGGLDADMPPVRRETHLYRPQDWLDLVVGGQCLIAPQPVDRRPSCLGANRRVALVQTSREDRTGREQLARHTVPLGSLAGEDERDLVGLDRREPDRRPRAEGPAGSG